VHKPGWEVYAKLYHVTHNSELLKDALSRSLGEITSVGEITSIIYIMYIIGRENREIK
jgi:hypothetical protein